MNRRLRQRTVAFLILALAMVYLCPAQKQPITEMESVADTYHGLTIEDPYRYMENLDDTVVQNWFKKQSNFSDSIVNKLPERTVFFDAMNAFRNRKAFEVSKRNTTKNGGYFCLKVKAGEDNKKLFYKKNDTTPEQLIFNPKDYKPGSGIHYSINYIRPSWDGRYVAVALSHGGKEFSEIITLDIKTQKRLPGILQNGIPASYGGIDWLPDNSGFTYLYFKEIGKNYKNILDNTVVVLHNIGAKAENSKVVLERKDIPGTIANSESDPIIDIPSEHSKYMIAYLINVGKYWDAYYADVSELGTGKINWKTLFKEKDMVYGKEVSVHGETLYFKSAKNASNYKIAKVDMRSPDFVNPVIVVNEIDDELIDDFVLTTEGLVVATTKNGVQAKLYLKQGTLQELPLPKKSGRIKINLNKTNHAKISVSLSGWLNDYLEYSYDIKTASFEKQSLASEVLYPEFSNFVVEEVTVTSHDGESVPLSIIYDKTIARNGKNPTLIFGYGAYGTSIKPSFSFTRMSWVANGGVYAIAHVRGGGEKGDSWHKAGHKQTKPNTWKDLIACSEYLIEKGFTSKSNLSAYGGSAGGIMVTRAMIERPDLFSSIISGVGYLNPLRMEANAKITNTEEYGTVKDRTECMALINADPYVNLKKGAKYPAVFLTTGINDIRVPPWMPGKFLAKLKEYSSSNKPALLRVSYDGGHKSGDKKTALYKKWSEIFAFALWQTGHPEYQPKN